MNPTPFSMVARNSYDDILDLRAGEPTAAFSAASVRHKVDELDFSSLNIYRFVTLIVP